MDRLQTRHFTQPLLVFLGVIKIGQQLRQQMDVQQHCRGNTLPGIQGHVQILLNNFQLVLADCTLLTLTVLIYSLCTGLSAFSQDFIQFGIFRFITGLGVGGVFGLAARTPGSGTSGPNS